MTGSDATPPGTERVRVLTRPGCHLCENAIAVVDAVCRETGVGWTSRDISLDPELTRRYGEQIPVTFVDGEQHDFWRVDASRLRAALARPPTSTAADRALQRPDPGRSRRRHRVGDLPSLDRAPGSPRLPFHHPRRGGGGAVRSPRSPRSTWPNSTTRRPRGPASPSAAALRKWTSAKGSGTLYRIDLRLAGPDPRVALRAADDLTEAELSALGAKLDRMDRAAPQPWTRQVLRQIAQRPAVVSTELAADAGLPRDYFKIRVRRLKALGLTESLEIGYRLSPRGVAYLRWLGAIPARSAGETGESL